MQNVIATTGASAGIGRATAVRLARDGASLALWARRLDRLNEVAEGEFFDVMTSASGFATRASGPRQSAGDVANAVARAIDHPAPEVFPYRMARGLVLLNAIAPAFCDRLVKKRGRAPVTP